ncbi:hypothetical protein M413DRAFT_443105 [Hebeloma cylindrosporum]|uniref:F-box domain-containing protein n=1 Tax=Hebeloma cylindrosporum TaxID=76867 RepID=A0A0C3C5B5_HEBCY|nr:hypothetical protein M413DRAFT_443105 [Hebeloma cylindrosporum h7]
MLARDYPHLDTLLRNNEVPSVTTIAEVTGLLQPLLKDCEDVDTEIERLDSLLREQKARRLEMQSTVDQYNTILSPARRLPADILHEIFWHCLPTHRNSVMLSSEAPLLLTRICSSWRAIAFASPKIWSKLHIPLLGDPGVSSGCEIIRDGDVLSRRYERFAQLMRSRCSIVREWLSRSGTCPLSLSVSYPGNFPNFGLVGDENQPDNGSQSAEEMFGLLLSFAHRWDEIHISMPMKIYEIFQSSLSPKMFPNLRVFHANLFELHRSENTTPVQLLAAPNLRRISINVIRITLNPLAHPVQPIWTNLTDIDFLGSITDKYLLELLRKCPNLVRGSFPVLSSWPDPTTDMIQGQPVSLPHLKSLSISDSGHTRIMVPSFKSIQAPSLKSLRYQWSNADRTPIPGNINLALHVAAPVLHFLETSPPVEKLFLEGVLSRENFRECLRLTPKVTHLMINRAPFPNPGSSIPFFPVHGFDPDFVRPDNIEMDVLCGDGAESDSPAVEPDLILPKLEILEAYDIRSFGDEQLLRFIANRTGPSRKSGVTQLKRVTVHFLRPRQLDITGEVQRLAQAAGVDLHLDLSYATAGPKEFDRLSALSGSSGLTQYDPLWSSEIS